MVTTRCRVDLQKEDAELFTKYLKDNGIYFEPSENYNQIHFECDMTDSEMNAANKWLEENL